MEKQFLTFIATFILSLTSYANETLFYRIRLNQDIDKAAQRLVVKGLENADKAGAACVIIDIDTYGGAVDAADSIRTAILSYEKPVVAYINMQAASAGALISIACDSIYMKTGSLIGAATVVNQNGEVMPEKYQSFMRGMMRATAHAKGRNPQIAEQMVDTANVLSLTPEEAIEVGYCEGKAETVNEVIHSIIGDNDFVIRSMDDDMTLLDKIIQILLNPLLQSIFMMMIIGGIFVEIRTPGIGLPLITAILGALLYFAPLYIENLAVSWEILLFVCGLILIALEIFVIPGFGIAGISGIVAVVVSLAFAMIDNSELFHWDGTLNLHPLIRPAAIVILSITAAIFGSIWLVRRLYNTKSFDAIALRQEMKASDGFTGVVSGLENLVGQEVVVFSDLKPAGKVKTSDGKIYEAILTFGGYAEKGSPVKVLRTEQGRLYCDKC